MSVSTTLTLAPKLLIMAVPFGTGVTPAAVADAGDRTGHAAQATARSGTWFLTDVRPTPRRACASHTVLLGCRAEATQLRMIGSTLVKVTRKLRLTGDTLDLQYLAAALPMGDVLVINDGGRFYVTSKEADDVADAQVPEVARNLVARINGIGRLQNLSFVPVEFSGIYEDDAGVTVLGGAAQIGVRAGTTAEVVVRDADGNVVPQPPPPGPGRLAAAETNHDVAEVLEILGRPEPPNFAELYKIDEIIKSSGRLAAVLQSAGISDQERKRFKQTADHQDASGADSRHARNKQQPPKHPMSIGQAREMINKLVAVWFDSL